MLLKLYRLRCPWQLTIVQPNLGNSLCKCYVFFDNLQLNGMVLVGGGYIFSVSTHMSKSKTEVSYRFNW